ncbi:MAG TPA: MMPL family transporter [Solirubrobacteraceae bacterium]|nr:MMPL family transporter [Solirubrobacteraceae bacterium]
MSTLLQRLAGVAARRPAVTAGIVLALAIAGGVLALGLRPSAAVDTFVSRSSSSYRATVAQQRLFGANGVQVLVSAPVTRLLAPAQMRRLTALEACLGGRFDTYDSSLKSYRPVAAGTHAAYGGDRSPCGQLMREAPTKVVYGPATFLNRAVGAFNADLRALLRTAQATDRKVARRAYMLALHRGLTRAQAGQAARAAAAAEAQRQLGQLEGLAGSTGIDRAPSIRDPTFLAQLVLDPALGAGHPAARFQYLFPTSHAALISVRLRQSLTDAQQARAIAAIRRAVAMPMFALGHGVRYTVTGETIVTDELAGQVTGAIGALLGIAVLVMAIVLLLVFRRRRGSAGGLWLRLLPLAVALAAVGITFGLLAVVGARLTVAAIAVLPILVGLAVDYAVQFQARVDEVTAEGTREGGAAVALAAARGGPSLATAALATAVAFVALQLSPVPMVRGFGLLLVVGVAVALGCALTAGAAALAAAIGTARRAPPSGLVRASLRGAAELAAWAPRRLVALLAPSVRGAGELLAAGTRTGRRRRHSASSTRPAGVSAPARVVAGTARRPALVLTAALALAIAGWTLSGQTRVQSDVTKLVPQDSRALRDLRTLEHVTGVSGEVDVFVRGRDVATPATLAWMTSYQNEVLRHFGYSSRRGCAQATLCPALSLTGLLSSLPGSTGGHVASAQIRQLLANVPGYFSQTVLAPDHRAATMAFGIRLMPLARQQRVLDYMRSHLAPPAGVSATLTGLPVLAAQANGSLSSASRRDEMLVAGLALVALVLLVALRSVRRALIPIVPIVLATGWSALIVYALGIPLNPMSAALGALVIAISTEFSVLLSERFAQERALGGDRDAALARTYRLTGAAVLASGTTAIAGFAVLIVSPIEMLRQFGVVTLVDLTVSLAGVLLVLPAVLTVGERRGRRVRRGTRGRSVSGPAVEHHRDRVPAA